MDSLKIKVIVGSIREGRFSGESAKWIMEHLKNTPGVEAELLDLKDYPLPFFSEPMTPTAIKEPYANPQVKKWTDKIAEGEAFIVVTPEYNHSIPGTLKNAIDYVGRQWNRKAVGFVAHGTLGGARSVEHLRNVFAELQMVSVRMAVYIITPWMLPKENGVVKAGALDSYNDAAKEMIGQVIWWGNAAKAARANG